MASSDESQILDPCPQCKMVLDVTRFEPYSKIECPSCKAVVHIRATFDHFNIEGVLGEGGMSMVYKAADPSLNRNLALKILHKHFSNDPERMEQFEREAKITASISHPNVVKVYSVGRDHGYFYIAMEMVENGSLDEMITRLGKVPEPQLLDIASQLAQGLRAAHQAGLIHRDLKPANMLFAGDTAKIVDFGLALVLKKDTDNSGEIWATPYYVSPEKLHGRPEDVRSDIYSLGASLFHAATGEPPCSMDTNSIKQLKAIKSKPIFVNEFAPEISQETQNIIDRMIALNPKDRYSDYDELIQHIEYASQQLKLAPPSTDTAPSVVYETMQMKAAKSKATNGAIVATLVTITALAGVIYLFKPSNDKEPATKREISTSTGGTINGRSITDQYLYGRKTLLAGDFEESANIFKDINQAPGIKQPTQNWTRLNAGLSYLLLGKVPEANPYFSSLWNSGKYSNAPKDKELADFFVTLGKVMENEAPITPGVAKELPTSGVEALGILAVGLKNWDRGNLENAAPFLTGFNNIKVPTDKSWIQGYKDLIKPHIADIEALNEAPDLGFGTELDDIRAAKVTSEAIASKLQTKGKIKTDFEIKITSLSERILSLEKQQAENEERSRQESLTTSSKLLIENSKKIRKYASTLEFDKAVEVLKGLDITSEKVAIHWKDQIHAWAGANSFLNQLVKDINYAGFEGTIRRTSGPPVRGKITQATREDWTLAMGASGNTKVPLISLSPQSLIEMADQFSMKVSDSRAYFKRRETMILFARQIGHTQFSKTEGKALARESVDFRTYWERLEKSPVPAPPTFRK